MVDIVFYKTWESYYFIPRNEVKSLEKNSKIDKIEFIAFSLDKYKDFLLMPKNAIENYIKNNLENENR